MALQTLIATWAQLSVLPVPLVLNESRWEEVLPSSEQSRDFCPQRRGKHADRAGATFLGDAFKRTAAARSYTCRSSVRKFGGTKLDGGKHICLDSLEPGRCVVYSLGSRGDFSFERDIVRQLNCSVYTFDCTV